MTTFLFKFEAIESWIASIHCLRGTTGRLQSLRLQGGFRVPNRRLASTASGKLVPTPEEAPTVNVEQEFWKDNEELAPNVEGGDVPASVWEKVAALRQKDLRRERLRQESQLPRSWKSQMEETTGQPDFPKHDTVPTTFPKSDNPNPSVTENALFQALRENDPHAALDALIKLVTFDGRQYTSTFLQSLSPNSFSAILRCLDPEHFVGRYGRLYKEMSPYTMNQLGLPDITHTGYHRFCVDFLSQIQGIIDARDRNDQLSLTDFKYSLKCARATGNVSVAQSIWKSMRAQRVVIPDAECYNHLLATLCWTQQFNPHQRYHLRVIPNNITPKASTTTLPYGMQGLEVGSSRGIKAQASRLFKTMVEGGVIGNEQTFCLMVTALAREGDTTGIASILSRVWGVDVEALLTTNEGDLPPVKSYALDSPFYPSGELLFTLAHVYGINNSVPTALRLIDYVSRQYNIPIPLVVWGELLQWTYVLSFPRSQRQMEKMKQFMIGNLPHEAAVNLWTTMTSEPYNVTPTIEMYSRIIVSLLRLQRFGQVKLRMKEARKIYEEHVLDVSRREDICKASATESSHTADMERRDLEFAILQRQRFTLYIRRWVRMYIRHASYSLRYSGTLTQQDMPKFLREWNDFLPPVVKYYTTSGMACFDFGTSFDWSTTEKDRTEQDKEDWEMWEFKQDDFDDID